MKIKLNKKFIARSISGVLLSLSITGTASAAGWPVTDYSLIAYLSGTLNGGTGVVELLTSVNAALAEQSSIIKNNFKNQNALDYDKSLESFQNKILNDHLIDTDGCEAATTASAGGGAVSNSSYSGYSSTQANDSVYKDPARREYKYLENIKDSASAGLCTDSDVTLNVPGCSTKGDYSNNANSGTSVLFTPLTDAQVQSKVVPMGGLSTDQQKVRDATIQTMVGVNAMDNLTNKDQANSLNGYSYLYTQNQENARKSFAAGLIMKDAAIENQIPAGSDTSLLKDFNWNDGGTDSPKAVWLNVFGQNANFPTNPSEWDLLTYQVYYKYAATTPNAFQIKIASMKDSDTLKEIARMQAISLRLELLQAQYLRESNTVQSLILATMLEKPSQEKMNTLNKNADLMEGSSNK